MIQIMEFVTAYYAWFLGVAILILLAVIGYCADKTNFGQDKNSKLEEEDKKIDLKNLKLKDALSNDVSINELENGKKTEIQNQNLESIEPVPTKDDVQDYVVPENLTDDTFDELELKTENFDLTSKVEETIVNTSLIDENLSQASPMEEIVNKNENSLLIEENFNRFNEEFNSILPEKGLINNDLLSDIENLELEKTQKFDLIKVPDLDDIELPKIKQLVEEEQDIWKF